MSNLQHLIDTLKNKDIEEFKKILIEPPISSYSFENFVYSYGTIEIVELYQKQNDFNDTKAP
jgi:hypothetical protein